MIGWRVKVHSSRACFSVGPIMLAGPQSFEAIADADEPTVDAEAGSAGACSHAVEVAAANSAASCPAW